MSVTESTPYGRPAARQQFVLDVTMGEQMRTPLDVIGAIGRAMYEYSKGSERSQVPFDQQPALPVGDIKDRDGVIVGTWRIEGGV